MAPALQVNYGGQIWGKKTTRQYGKFNLRKVEYVATVVYQASGSLEHALVRHYPLDQLACTAA